MCRWQTATTVSRHRVQWQTMDTPSQFVALLDEVRARHRLPNAAERRRIREDAGLSLRAVGGALGVSHSAVAAWETGATPREHRAAYAQLLAELHDITAYN